MAELPFAEERAAAHRAVAAARTIQSLMDHEPDHVLARPWNEILPDAPGGGPAIDKVIVMRGFASIGGGVWMNDHRGNVYAIYSGVTAYSARFLIYGWSSQSAMLRAGGYNVNSYRDAGSAESVGGLFLLVNSHSIYIYGHSGGGCVAEALASHLLPNPTFSVRELITFGAPKPALQGFTDERLGTTRIRWMNYADPVPDLPLSRLTSNVTIALDLVSADYSPDLIRHGTGGRLLMGDGTWSSVYSSRGPIGANSQGVVSWLAGLDANRGLPHSIDTYILRLGRFATGLDDTHEMRRQGPPADRPRQTLTFPARLTPPGGLDPNPGILTIQGNIATTPGGSTFPVGSGRNTDMASQSKVAPSLRLTYARAGAVWIVGWNDLIVFTCPYGSNARSIVRSWNRSIRLLGKTSDIHSASFAAYFQQLFAAGAAGQGITPAWVVT